MKPEQALPYIKPYLDTALTTGRYTHGFLNDLATSIAQEIYDPHPIIDEIALLEGRGKKLSKTKSETMFTGKHLKGLWHKHHTQSRFMAHNMLGEMNRNRTVERFLKPHECAVATPCAGGGDRTDVGSVPRALSRLHGQALPRTTGQTAQLHVGLHGDRKKRGKQGRRSWVLPSNTSMATDAL